MDAECRLELLEGIVRAEGPLRMARMEHGPGPVVTSVYAFETGRGNAYRAITTATLEGELTLQVPAELPLALTRTPGGASIRLG